MKRLTVKLRQFLGSQAKYLSNNYTVVCYVLRNVQEIYMERLYWHIWEPLPQSVFGD